MTLVSDSSPTEWHSLSTVAADDALQVKLLLAPSVKLISSPFSIDMIWQMNQQQSLANAIEASTKIGVTFLLMKPLKNLLN